MLKLQNFDGELEIGGQCNIWCINRVFNNVYLIFGQKTTNFISHVDWRISNVKWSFLKKN